MKNRVLFIELEYTMLRLYTTSSNVDFSLKKKINLLTNYIFYEIIILFIYYIKAWYS